MFACWKRARLLCSSTVCVRTYVWLPEWDNQGAITHFVIVKVQYVCMSGLAGWCPPLVLSWKSGEKRLRLPQLAQHNQSLLLLLLGWFAARLAAIDFHWWRKARSKNILWEVQPKREGERRRLCEVRQFFYEDMRAILTASAYYLGGIFVTKNVISIIRRVKCVKIERSCLILCKYCLILLTAFVSC